MKKDFKNNSRRKFIYNAGLTAFALPMLSSLSNCKSSQLMGTNKNKKLGVALVGLGSYAGGQLAPALLETEHCYLAGIVTGTPSKIPEWKAKYNIPDKNIYSYDNYDSIKDNPDIDIIYVVLPNSMHAEYTIRGFEAGKHVICEKPMAITVSDCDKMIAAAKKANKFLSIGYRLHFEPFNLEMMRLGKKQVYGKIKKLSGGYGFPAKPNQWRLNNKYAGGGPMMDVGIYAVHGMCYCTGALPVAVTAQEGAKTDLERFKDVEQSLTWQMEFPDGVIGEGTTTYEGNANFLKVEAEKGIYELTAAYNYGGQTGSTPDGKMDFPRLNQQAKQMDGIAISIKNNEQSIIPGELGRRDMQIITAIYEAMKTGKKVMVSY